MAPKVTFSSPPRSRLLVFDAGGAGILGRTALKGLEYAVLPSRGEILFLSPAVIVRMIKYAGRIDWRLIALRRGRGLFAEIYKIHLLACVDYIRPDVVVTWIDNSWLFHKISRAYLSARFYAVQNGSRSVGCVTTNPPLRVPGGYVTSMPNLLCFGRYEEELYRSHGHDISSFHLVGPLIGGWHRSLKPIPVGPMKYEVCLVSQWREDIMTSDRYPEVKANVDTLARHLARYALERDLKVCVAARGKNLSEAVYYRGLFGPGVHVAVPEDDVLPLSTYEAMDHSAVVAAFCSTAALEAFGWGKKVLFANLVGHVESYSPRPGPWSIQETGYEAFRAKLDALRAMSPAEYDSASAEFRHYSISADPAKPAHIYLRELVDQALAAKGTPE